MRVADAEQGSGGLLLVPSATGRNAPAARLKRLRPWRRCVRSWRRFPLVRPGLPFGSRELGEREDVVEGDERLRPPVGLGRGTGRRFGPRLPGNGLRLGLDLRLSGDDCLRGDIEDG